VRERQSAMLQSLDPADAAPQPHVASPKLALRLHRSEGRQDLFTFLVHPDSVRETRGGR